MNPVWSRLVRPENDNGRGIHWSASVYHIEFKNGNEWARWKAELAALKIKWVKILDDGGDSSLGLATALWHECGIVPIVRLYRHEPEPGSITSREVDTIKRIVAACGIPIPFETKNEPDLSCEWRDGKKPERWWDSVIQTSGEDAQKVLDAGGIWLFPAFTHGATLTVPGENPYYNNVLRMFADVHGKKLLQESGIAIHNYVINHPLDYPYDAVNQDGKKLTQAEYDRDGAWAWDNQLIETINQWRKEDKNTGDTVLNDWTCFNAWQVWDQWAQDVTGGTLPIFTTEGGANISGRNDRRYPRTTPQMHLDTTLAIEKWMMDEAPEQYVCNCHWLIADAEMGHAGPYGNYTTWESQCWYTWYYSESQWRFKGQIPTVAAVKAMPSYPRKYGGGGVPTPEPEPPAPEPEPGPPPDVDWQIPLTQVKLVPAGVKPGDTYWKLIEARWENEEEAQGRHHIYVEVLTKTESLISGMPVAFMDGGTVIARTEADKPLEFGMYGVLGSYTVYVAQGISDWVTGLGMGTPGQPTYAIHTCFYLTFQEATAEAEPEPPESTPDPSDRHCILIPQTVDRIEWETMLALEQYWKTFRTPITPSHKDAAGLDGGGGYANVSIISTSTLPASRELVEIVWNAPAVKWLEIIETANVNVLKELMDERARSGRKYGV